MCLRVPSGRVDVDISVHILYHGPMLINLNDRSTAASIEIALSEAYANRMVNIDWENLFYVPEHSGDQVETETDSPIIPEPTCPLFVAVDGSPDECEYCDDLRDDHKPVVVYASGRMIKIEPPKD